jgi:hypothetical protein
VSRRSADDAPPLDLEVGRPAVPDLGPVEVVPIDSVRPAPDNPRKITPRAVQATARSIRTFGWQQPLVVDRDGELIVGHTRHLAAKSLGLTTVPITRALHLTPAEVRAYRITDNRTGDFTTWDFPALTVQLEELAGEFAEVLELADWQGIVTDFNALQEGDGLDVDEDVDVYLATKGHSLVIVCATEDAARRVASAVVDMEGVLDVRDKRG